MSQHSIVEHRANYFHVRLEDDYLAMYERLAESLDLIKEQNGLKLSGPSDCKAMIASVLEHWMNSKRLNAKCEDDLYVYFTYDEWEQQLRYRYRRSTIIQCIKEMEEEGQWTDKEGEVHIGTIKKRPYVQNTYAYLLNLPVVQGLLSELPEQSPYGPRPKVALGRPRKKHSKINRLKINGINLNGLKTDDIDEIPSEKTRINDEIPSENKRPFYTHISNTTDLNKTQINESAAHADADHTNSSYQEALFKEKESAQETPQKPENQPASYRRNTGGKSTRGRRPAEQITLQGQHIIDLYQELRKRRITLNDGNIRAANGLADVVESDEDFRDVFRMIQEDQFLNQKNVTRDLDFMYRKYDGYIDKVIKARFYPQPSNHVSSTEGNTATSAHSSVLLSPEKVERNIERARARIAERKAAEAARQNQLMQANQSAI